MQGDLPVTLPSIVVVGGQTTTPRKEWRHVADPKFKDELPKGKDVAGVREKRDPKELYKNMFTLIKRGFAKIGWSKNAEALTKERVDKLGVSASTALTAATHEFTHY